MESLRALRLRGNSWTAPLGGSIVFFVFVVPLVASFVHYALQAWSGDSLGLSWIFFRVLGGSLLFTIAQAAMSATCACAVGLALGTLLAPLSGAFGFRLRRFCETLGLISFSLPGVAIALLVMDLNGRFAFPPANGFWAIVCAHVLFNALYVASAFAVRARAWLASGGLETVEAATTLGARGTGLLKLAFGALWVSEAKVWFPLVFLWAFSAFATLLLLGGGSGQTSLEVLLFHSLQNDPDTGRILVLMLLQGGVGLGLSLWIRRALSKRVEFSQGTGVLPEGRLGWWAASTWRWASGIGLLLSALPIMWLFLAPIFSLAARNFAPLFSLAPALGASLVLAALTGLFSVGFSRLLVGASSAFRSGTMLLGAFSTTLLVASWMGVGFDLLAEGSIAMQLSAAALGLALTNAPWMALRMEARLRSVPEELLEAAATLGCSPAQATRWVEWPLVSDIVSRAALTAFVSALGEIAIAGLFLRDVNVAATEARRLANRYDFEGASALMLFLLLSTIMAIWVRSRFMRGSEREREGVA